MIENLPLYISLIFGLITLITLCLFVDTVRNSSLELTRKKTVVIAIGLFAWLVIQAFFTLSEMYQNNTNSFPSKIIIVGILPVMTFIFFLFTTTSGREFIESLPLKNLTYLSIVRVPVEIVLYWLFIHRAIPELMTFQGRNFDILAGLSAPFVAYFGFSKFKLSKKIILIWNLISLFLLLNIVVNAILSAPSPIQKFAFEQPNIAILNFPFVWLPTFIVPIVLLSHLTSIKQLAK